MPKVDAPLSSKTYKNVDGVELSDDSISLKNGYFNEAGSTVKRPGLKVANYQLYSVSAVSWGADPITGITFTPGAAGRIVITKDRELWSTVENDVFNFASDPAAGAEIGLRAVIDTTPSASAYSYPSGKRPSFAYDGTNFYLANGGQIYYTADLLTMDNPIADADAPTEVTHIAYLDGYILALEANSETFWFSEVGDGLDWKALYYENVDASPDNVVALHVFNRQIYLFGENSIEVWENDGETPFSRVPTGFYEVGCIAPYSVVNTDNSIIWLDDRRRFVELSYGGSLNRLNTDYDKLVQSFKTISDCYAFRMEISGQPFYIFQFPSEGRTLAYNHTQGSWAEWTSIRPDGTEGAWIGSCYTFNPYTNKHYVGGNDGELYELSENNTNDNGQPIRLERLTGHIDYGTSDRKQCNSLSLRLKRGVGSSTETPTVQLRWNDDNKGFSNELPISLGDIGDQEIYMKVYPMGIYRTRQYELVSTSDVPVIFLSAKEDIEVLED